MVLQNNLHTSIGLGALFCLSLTLSACSPQPEPAQRLRQTLAQQDVTALEALPSQPAAKIELGRALFFDPILSGNRDVACATCHLPEHGSGDGRRLPIGTGGRGLGPERELGEGRDRIPRNSPELIWRGEPSLHVMMWDGRFQRNSEGIITTPAGSQLPDGLESALAIQVMFPVTSREEMRGDRGDVDIFGAPNELAAIFDSDFQRIWGKLIERLLEQEGYRSLFARAYPELSLEQMGFAQAANAIAAFMNDAFSPLDSPFDRFLAGEDDALSAKALQGAQLFYGAAGCSSCHSGSLLTDQRFHNLAVPQIGPGKLPEAPLDEGRKRHSVDPSMRYAFRTPPLRDVGKTAPYMHDGAFDTLRQVIEHHVDPEASLKRYDCEALEAWLQPSCRADRAYHQERLEGLDAKLASIPRLDKEQIQSLLAFLAALDSPSQGPALPKEVPSGLAVAGAPKSRRRAGRGV